jgi:peptidoglycan/xylan/chitin deacetylase (PgdA/CDA1 family)
MRKKIKHLKHSLSVLAFYSGIARMFMMSRRSGAVTLAYHRIINNCDTDAFVSYSDLHVSPADFLIHTDFLKKHFNVVENTDYIRNVKIRNRKPLCLITFDDGWHDNYHNAWPILRNHGMTGLIFPAINFIEKQDPYWTHKLLIMARNGLISIDSILNSHGITLKEHHNKADHVNKTLSVFRAITRLPHKFSIKIIREIEKTFEKQCDINLKGGTFVSWNQLKEMADGGMIIGSHSVSHEPLTILSSDRLYRELVWSRAILREKTGYDVRSLSFPSGLFDSSLEEPVKAAGYNTAFAGENLNKPLKLPSGLTIYPRFTVTQNSYTSPSGHFSPALFYCNLSGIFSYKPLAGTSGRQ